MIAVLTEVPNSFNPLDLFIIAAILIISLSIKTWIKRARDKKRKKNQL
jgi:hypothetical protein